MVAVIGMAMNMPRRSSVRPKTVMATMMMISGFQAIPPTGVNLKPHPEEDQDQVLGIDANGQYYLNKKAIKNETLGAQLKRDVQHAREVLGV